MSFEGYYQVLCVNGHLLEIDVYDVDVDFPNCDEEWECEYCNEKIAWWNIVDETNGSFDINSDGYETRERIDGYVYLEMDKGRDTCICPTCGIVHFSTDEAPTYKLPEGKRGHIVNEQDKHNIPYGGFDGELLKQYPELLNTYSEKNREERMKEKD